MIASNGPHAGDRLEQVAQSKVDAIGHAELGGVAPGDVESRARSMSIATNRAAG